MAPTRSRSAHASLGVRLSHGSTPRGAFEGVQEHEEAGYLPSLHQRTTVLYFAARHRRVDRASQVTVPAQALRAGLVDELQLIVCPVVVGGGKRFFPDGVRLNLELVEERRFGNGVVVLRYAVRG